MIPGGGACTSRRSKRETSSVYVPLGGGIVPASPIFSALSGAVAGQKTVTFAAPATLVGGADIAGDPVTAYRVYWRVGTSIPFDLSAYTAMAQVSAATLSYAITGLTSGTTLYVRVTAVNASGESDPTSEDSATVP